MTTETRDTLCPSCGERGRAVSVRTVTSMLSEQARARLSSAERFLFCRTQDCDVSYFGDETFLASDVRVPIFQKSTDPARPVCYCFNHSAAAIKKDVEQAGTSTVSVSFRESCKNGLVDCEKNTPQGSCCLGNVTRIVKSTLATDAPCEKVSCCADTRSEPCLGRLSCV